MDQMFKQVFFYLTFGGFGIWTIYRLLTLNGKLKKYNRDIAIQSGLSESEIIILGL
jgi:flagellar biogenesis protein FliO